jgi:hypothetical protein
MQHIFHTVVTTAEDDLPEEQRKQLQIDISVLVAERLVDLLPENVLAQTMTFYIKQSEPGGTDAKPD